MLWCSVGEFNVITNVEEKLGGLPYDNRKRIDSITVIVASCLMEIGFSGHKYTWTNKRGINKNIWKGLYKDFVTDSLLERMPQTTITHLSATRSNHYALLMEIASKENEHIRYFRFLNFMVDNSFP